MRRADGEAALGAEAAWGLLRALASRAGRDDAVEGPCVVDETGNRVRDTRAGSIRIDAREPRGWAKVPDHPPPSDDVARLLDLYVPLCVGPRSSDLVVGHLGQSLDGRIATNAGVSQFITGEQNVEHAHRMRALFDAVLVGAGTVEEDDPRLTTRRVPGEHATRVVLDPSRRLGADYAVFRDDQAPTLLVCRAASARGARQHGQAEIVTLAGSEQGELSTETVVAELRRRGLRRIFIEGGGVTVSRFLREGCLDRLHVAVAPMILGSGRPAFTLPVIETLSEALTFECRHFVTGADVLFDCALRSDEA